MCGICGVFNPSGTGPDDARIVRDMMSLLEHRGPDGEGFWASDAAVLGHRRLAIIDLAGGWQPIFNETREIGVIFNGEIYNFQQLRRELESAGHDFRTLSDTEVIVHGYEKWGDDFVSRLRGMFAFAIYDAPRRRLLLARDRFGVKPLYYAETSDGRILFASEIKALFADPSVPRAVNSERMPEYLAFRCVAGEETLFDGIREIQPGTVMALENGRRTVRQYWTPEALPASRIESGDLVERGSLLLDDAVRCRLVSDVALGTITSGGLDSSLVSAIAASHSDHSIDTFCVGFVEPEYDERRFAGIVARQIGSNHHDLEVTPEAIEREIECLTWAHDEPLTHPNSIPMHLIFRLAKETAGVTVLLSGEGADEVFGGYEWYAVASRRDGLRRIPLLSPAARFAPSMGKLATLKKVLARDYLVAANAVSDGRMVGSLVHHGGDYLDRRKSLWPREEASTSGLFIYDQRTYLPPLLQRQDRMSMAAGLEAREPFLDHHLVEWANSLSARLKIAGGVRKALLKSIASRWLPDQIIKRKKVGFEMPLGRWMRAGGPLRERVQALRDPGSFSAGVADPAAIKRLIDEHDRGVTNHADVLWTLISLDSWATIFLGAKVKGEVLPGAHTGKAILV